MVYTKKEIEENGIKIFHGEMTYVKAIDKFAFCYKNTIDFDLETGDQRFYPDFMIVSKINIKLRKYLIRRFIEYYTCKCCGHFPRDTCTIRNEEKVLLPKVMYFTLVENIDGLQALSICNPNDNFSREDGRTRALNRLQEFSKKPGYIDKYSWVAQK